MNCMFSGQKDLLFKAPLGLEDPFWLIFGTLFGYPLGQKSRRGTPEAQGLEHKVQGPEHESNMLQALWSGAFGRLPGTALGGLGAFSGPKCVQKGCQRDVRKGSKGS